MSGTPSARPARATSAALRRLVERDPKLSRYGEPLHFAVREGHLDAVRVLLDAGADAGCRRATTARRWRRSRATAATRRSPGFLETLSRSARTACSRHDDRGSRDPCRRGRERRGRRLRELLDAEPQLVASRRSQGRHAAPSRGAGVGARGDRRAARSWRRHPRSARLGSRRRCGLCGRRFPAHRPGAVLAWPRRRRDRAAAARIAAPRAISRLRPRSATSLA